MIISRTPLRVSLMGGGTDIPAVYRALGGGEVVGFAIKKYMYLSIHSFSEPFFRFKYSKVEDCPDSFSIEHNLARESFKRLGLNLSGVECASLSDVPAGTGLASSSAFTVALLKLLTRMTERDISNLELAAIACEVEIDRVGSPIGKQDQHLCALGGINRIFFHADDRVTVEPIAAGDRFLEGIRTWARLYRVGEARSASRILKPQVSGPPTDMDLEKFRSLASQVGEIIEAVQKGDFNKIGQLLLGAWERKLSLSPSKENKRINKILEQAVEAGAFGGKLLGAGDGGFLLLLADDHDAIAECVGSVGIPIAVDFDGASVIADDRTMTATI